MTMRDPGVALKHAHTLGTGHISCMPCLVDFRHFPSRHPFSHRYLTCLSMGIVAPTTSRKLGSEALMRLIAPFQAVYNLSQTATRCSSHA